jgi:serine/threonine protein phosphatase 1
MPQAAAEGEITRVFGLLQRFARSSNRPAAVPEGTRVYAIGDVHGCLDTLDALLSSISDDCGSWSGESHLVFVGDLIDRGPDSAGVVERLVRSDLPCDRHAFLMGNHEEAMLDSWNGDMQTLHGWLSYGGRETLESYGVERDATYRLGPDLVIKMRAAIPKSHMKFIRSFADQVRIGDYLFVHAGIRPGIPLKEQDSYDLRWIRDEFLKDEDTNHGVVVVHGHTISHEPEIRSNRIGIDTGCYATGRLTALVLEGTERRFLSTSADRPGADPQTPLAAQRL